MLQASVGGSATDLPDEIHSILRLYDNIDNLSCRVIIERRLKPTEVPRDEPESADQDPVVQTGVPRDAGEALAGARKLKQTPLGALAKNELL